MDDVVKFRKLSKNDQALKRCGVVMFNQMQCPGHAFIELPNDPVQYMCAFHTANAVSTATQNHKQYLEV